MATVKRHCCQAPTQAADAVVVAGGSDVLAVAVVVAVPLLFAVPGLGLGFRVFKASVVEPWDL